ncbi:MBL fold metallo-hydrolase [Halobellus sp. Atlit-38R]|nr:MBL fold metallo-hydrolase [Halobellus sp. Atlit-38R]
MTEIAPDVYDITVKIADDARWRVFLFDGETPTLVDAGFEDTVDVVAGAAEELGITPERVVITHGDPDHVGGLAGLVARFDLETWVPEGVEVDVDVDHRFGDGDPVGPFTAVSVAGHATGHHSLVDESRGIAVIGDALFGSDARGLPAGYFVLPTAYYSEDLATADAELSNLLEYDFDVGLVFHGSSVTEDASEKIAAFVDFAGKR